MITKPGGRRNFGFGNRVGYAVGNILKDRYGDQRYGTRITYLSRIQKFLKFLDRAEIKDLAKVSRSDIAAYTDLLREHVEDQRCALSTAVHHLSAVNVVMSHARHDDKLRMSPAEEIGRRDYVRDVAPEGLDITSPSQLLSASCPHLAHCDAIITVLGIARFAGARFREASLTPIKKALAEIRATGSLNMIYGTKGGRTVSRPVPGSDELIEVLEFAESNLGRDFVIPSHWNYVKWKCYAYRHMPKLAASLRIAQRFHDLRASYACVRYKEITGVDAPTIAGYRLASKELDGAARELISRELGHCRAQICVSYIGSAR